MQVNYLLDGRPHELSVGETDDLAELCARVEKGLRAAHADLADAPHLAEKVADGLLNALSTPANGTDLGEIA
ncbi:hypothetical protein [Streptomyces sp. NBC_00829]|uniref:hypothetical protein n=1 Tax=Streptomyces sp. NBC_00829 TaxID=2903679 RepID=UPI003870B70E|nr:hypothetical protein OG293_06120 [Streptomyces sp. NBC_00829]